VGPRTRRTLSVVRLLALPLVLWATTSGQDKGTRPPAQKQYGSDVALQRGLRMPSCRAC